MLDDKDDAAAVEWVRAGDPIPHGDLAELGALLMTSVGADKSKTTEATPHTAHALGSAPALHC